MLEGFRRFELARIVQECCMHISRKMVTTIDFNSRLAHEDYLQRHHFGMFSPLCVRYGIEHSGHGRSSALVSSTMWSISEMGEEAKPYPQ